MRSPSWIRAARSGTGLGLAMRARERGWGKERKTACPKTSFLSADMLSINTRFTIHIPLLSPSISKMASANVDRAIQSAVYFLARRERSVVLQR